MLEASLSKPGPRMVQIGTEGGFLPVPVVLNSPLRQFSVQEDSMGNPIPSTLTYTLLIAPAERADLIIDFSKVPAGSKLILYNDAPAPFRRLPERLLHWRPRSDWHGRSSLD
jgi:hypothetical protein